MPVLGTCWREDEKKGKKIKFSRKGSPSCALDNANLHDGTLASYRDLETYSSQRLGV